MKAPTGALVVACMLAGSVAAVRWSYGGEGVQPYDLAACVELGLERNPTLRKLALNVAVARENVMRTRGVYDGELNLGGVYEDSELPTQANPVEGATKSLLARAGASRALSSGTTVGLGLDLTRFEFQNPLTGVKEVDTSVVGLSLSQPLWRNAFGGLDRAQVKGAEEAYEGARLEYLYERDRLAARVHDAYWDANAALKRYEVNEHALVRSRELLELNRAKFDDGLIEETEILAAEAALATREVDVLSSRDASRQTRDILLELIAVPVGEWDATAVRFYQTAPPMASVADVDMFEAFDTAVDRRPDLAAVRALRRSTRYELEVRRQQARPDLSLTGRIGRGSTDENVGRALGFEETVWSVGLQFSTPWSRTAERAAVRETELRLRQFDREYEALERVVLLECRLAARNLRTSRDRVDAAAKARAIEARKLELEQEKLRQGRTSTRFVVEYQDDLEFAELNYVDAAARYQKDLARYRLVQGILLEVLGLDDAGLEGPGEAP